MARDLYFLGDSAGKPKAESRILFFAWENAIGGMADGGIFWIPSKYWQLEHFRLPSFRQ